MPTKPAKQPQRKKKTATPAAKGAGRPTRYRVEYAEQAYKMCLLGATDEQLADFFNISIQTFYNWKKKHQKFVESIKDGKDRADSEIAQALYHRAKGYSHPEDKIMQYEGQPLIVPTTKHYPPDTAAAFIWLKNRQPEKWMDRQEVTGPGGGPVQVETITRRLIKPED